MNLKDDIRPITYLKNNTAELVREISRDGRTVTITQNGEAKVVVMDVESYDRMRRSMALLKLVALGEADVEAGRLVPHSQALARAAAVIEEAAE